MSVGVAVVGLGVMGRNHLRILSQLPEVRLVGAYDPDEAAGRVAENLGVSMFQDLGQLRDAAPELVVIAVPTNKHRSVVEAVLRPGMSLLVEKPLAASIEDGEAILAAARAVGARVGVGHVERFNPMIVALKELLQAEHLGRTYAFSARRLGPYPPRIGDVGVVIDLGTHDLDAITHLHPRPVIRVHAELHRTSADAHEHMASAIFRFDDDVLATIEVNWMTPTKVRELTVTGERGMFVGNYLSQELSFIRRSSGDSTMRTGEMQYLVERESVDISLARAEPLRRELEAFISASRGDREMPITGEEGLRVLKLAHAVRDAGLSGSATTPEAVPS